MGVVVAIRKMRARRLAVLAMGIVAVAPIGCGGEDFKNEPRPPAAAQLTGVIQDDKVTVSPNRVGAGPILLTISNQTDQAHTVTLEGEEVRERVGPINPLDTATIQSRVSPGLYEVRAGSAAAVPKEIAPAELDVGEPRPSSSGETQLP